MPKHVFKIEDGRFGLSLTDPSGSVADVCDATIADYTAFTCQITNGALTPSPNVTTETVEATWCDPEEQTPLVGATSYTLDLSYLQDPDIEAGISRFLFEHDADEAFFFMGLDGDAPPKARGKVRVTSGAIGGPGRQTLTADTSLPCDGKPQVCFGTTGGGVAIGGGVPATAMTAGTPGETVPNGADAPATRAIATSTGVDAIPATAWTTGQFVTMGDGTNAYWNGTAWTAGVAP